MTFLDQRKYWLGALLWCAAGLFFWQTTRPGHDWGGDFSVYLWQAENLATGRPYTESSFLVTPRSARNHPAVYPPLTSLAMSPFRGWLGRDYQAWKRLLTVPLWLSLPVWCAIGLRLGLPFWPAALATLLFSGSTLVFWVRDSIGSDTLYQLVSGLALLLILEGKARGWDTRHALGWGAAVALLLLLSYATRAASLAQVAALFATELYRERRITPFLWTTGLCLLAGLLAYNRWIFSAGGQYAQQFVFLPRAYLSNLIYYLRSHASLWQGAPAAARYLLSTGVLLLALFALAQRLRRPTAAEGYLLVSYALVTVYSLTQNARYLMGVYPLLLFLAVLGLRQLALWQPAGYRLAWLAPAAAALAFGSLAWGWRTLDLGPAPAGVHQASFAPVCDFLQRQGGTVLSWNPRLFALYTRQPSAHYADPADLPAQVAAIPGRLHLVYYQHELDRAELDPYLAQHGAQWAIAYQNADFRIYRRREPTL